MNNLDQLQKIIISSPFNDKAKESFYNEFFSLSQSGVDIQRCLQLIHDEEDQPKRKQVIANIIQELIKGSSLSESLKKSEVFVPYEYHSINIGEETGKLKDVLFYLSKFFNDKVKLKRQLIGVLTYPIFVLLITFGVLYFMLSKVVPMFKDVFKQFGQELPFLTRQIILLSEYFTIISLTLIVCISCALIGFFYIKDNLKFRAISSSVISKIPIIGQLVVKVYLTRYCQIMSLLLSAKTPLVYSLELTQNMISFYPLEVAIMEMKTGIKKGEMLHSVMSKHKIFNNKMISLTKLAEEINQLDKTYLRLGEKFQEEVEFQTKLIGTIIEPAIIVLIGLIVGVIMIAMYLPMFELSNVVK